MMLFYNNHYVLVFKQMRPIPMEHCDVKFSSPEQTHRQNAKYVKNIEMIKRVLSFTYVFYSNYPLALTIGENRRLSI